MFALTTGAVFYQSQYDNIRLRLEFNQHAAELKGALEKSFSNYINAVRSLQSFYLASTAVDREEFRIFVAPSLDNFQGIQALEWSPIILSSEREAFEKNLKQEGYPNTQITERNAAKQILPAGNRLEYIPVSFVEPYKGNESALGYDLYSNEVRSEAINRARDTGEIAMSARIILIQEKGNQYGMLAIMPVYRKGLPHQTLAERRTNISSYVLAVFRAGDIVAAALKDLNRERLSYQLIDESAPATEQLIFSSGRKELKPLVMQEKGLFGESFSIMCSFSIPIGGRLWRFDVAPTQDYFSYYRSNTAWLILLAGLLLTGMVGVFVIVLSGRGSMLRRLVEERTAALAQSEERFRATFEGAPVGVATVSLTGSFINVNKGFCDLVGYSKDELLTMSFKQLTYHDYKQSDADLIRQTLAGEIPGFNVENRYVRKDGKLVWVNLSVKLAYHSDGSPDYFNTVIENIDDRKQADVQIKKSLSLLQATLESTQNAILVVDMNNTWVLQNQRFIDLWGITDEILAAKDDSSALSYVLNQLEDADAFINKVRELYESPESGSSDIFRLKNGKIIERYSIPQYIDGKVVGRVWSFLDITERKQVEETLQMMRFSVDHAGESIFWIGRDGKILYVNDAACVERGYSSKEMFGMKIFDLDPDYPSEIWESHFEDLKRQGAITLETRHRTKNGRVYPIEVNANYVHIGGHEFNFCFLHDISKRKQMEAELIRSNGELEQFAYAVSHDMRQPLRMVSSYLSLIEDALTGQLNQETKQFLDFALNGAKRMDSMITSLLDYSRVGRKSEVKVLFNSKDSLDEALAFLYPELSACGGSVHVTGNWPDLFANCDELTRLLQNLIGNALKYHLENQPPQVHVHAMTSASLLRVEVRDHGIGIEQSQIERLFKVFSRLQARTRFEGAGIGLALCRKIVEHHGGTIGVESAGEGQGSLFWFELPIVKE